MRIRLSTIVYPAIALIALTVSEGQAWAQG